MIFDGIFGCKWMGLVVGYLDIALYVIGTCFSGGILVITVPGASKSEMVI